MKNKICRRGLDGKAAGATTCILGLACLSYTGFAADAPKEETAKESAAKEESSADDAELRNWAEIGLGGNLVSGDKAAFQQRTGQPRDLWGGVTDFHYEMDVGKRALFEVDGRGIFDNNNYGITMGLRDAQVGYVRGGISEFRTYYDTSGGYFPGNGAFLDLYDTVWEVDRRNVFFEAGLTMPNKPEIRFRYDYDARFGDKNSTSWGETGLTGGAGSRKIVPAYSELDESRHTVSLDISHTISKTLVGIGGTYQFSTYENSRNMRRSPDEANNRYLTHREGADTDVFSARGWTDTDLNDKVKLTTAYSFSRLDSEIFGGRATGADFHQDPNPDAIRLLPPNYRVNRDHGFYNLDGGSDVNQHVGAISVMYRPTPTLTFIPALRIESQNQDGLATFVDTEVDSNRNVLQEDVLNTRSRDFLDVTERLEGRYTGVTNWVFYARADLTQGSGTLRESEEFIEDVTTSQILRETDSERLVQKYTAGANWYPLRRLNLAVQYYHRVRDNDYDHIIDQPPSAGAYPAFIEEQKFTTEDANIRVTFRPASNVTLISRYDFQYNTVDSKMQTLPEVESSHGSAHIITESITWVPLSRLFVQVSGSYTVDRLETPGDERSPAFLQRAENNYYTVTGTIGFALTEKTDVTASYAWFMADNYDPSMAATGLPLNRSLAEHWAGVSVAHHFSKRVLLTTRYAYLTSDDDTFGDNNDFEAHMVSTTLRYRF